MKKRTLQTGAAAALVGGLVFAGASVASAADTLLPDASSTGQIALENATGHVVTSGALDAPIASFAVGDSSAPVQYTVGKLFLYTPTTSDASLWGGDGQILSNTTYNPVTQYPTAQAFLGADHTADDTYALQLAIANGPSPAGSFGPGDGSGLYELRLNLGAPGLTDDAKYFTATIRVTFDGTTDPVSGLPNGTWTQVQPEFAAGAAGPTPLSTTPALPEAPLAAVLPAVALLAGAGVVVARRRKATV
jgi:hypothetical protein